MSIDIKPHIKQNQTIRLRALQSIRPTELKISSFVFLRSLWRFVLTVWGHLVQCYSHTHFRTQSRLAHSLFETRGHTHKNLILNFVRHINLFDPFIFCMSLRKKKHTLTLICKVGE